MNIIEIEKVIRVKSIVSWWGCWDQMMVSAEGMMERSGKGVIEKVIERVVNEWFSIDAEERGQRLVEAVAYVLVAENIVKDAGIGERSKMAEEIVKLLSENTLRDAMRLVWEAG